MGIDRPYDDDTPADSRVDDSEVDSPGVGDEPDFASNVNRDTYTDEFRAKVDAVYLDAVRERWDAARPGFEAEWHEYARRQPTPADTSAKIDGDVSAQVERGCKEIRETEENIVTPAMVRIESEDTERQLVGLEFRCKGHDRIMEKIAHDVQYKGRTPEDALANLKDAIRYTFQYTEQHYAKGVLADIERLKSAGFELVELRNSWDSADYKGINSRWRVPEGGQLCEVQFHTQISFEAKQLTHPAYERLRNPSTSKAEQDELAHFQRRVNDKVPNPDKARDIPNYP